MMKHTRAGFLPVLALLVAMFVVPPILGAIQQGPQRRPVEPPTAVAAAAQYAPATATPLPWPPTRMDVTDRTPEPTRVLPEVTPTPGRREAWPGKQMWLETVSEREGVEWMRSVGQ